MLDVGVYEPPADTNIGSPPDNGFLHVEKVKPSLVTIGAVCGTPAFSGPVVPPPVPPCASHVTVY